MKIRMMAIVVACCCSMASAQVGDYLGPGVLSRGAGDIGKRAGEDVTLRYYGSAMGIYDNGLLPFALDNSGNLVKVDGLWGAELDFGAYGVHDFRHARLGLDYKGTYRYYNQNTFYSGTDQQLALGYSYQKSRRLAFDMRQIAGSITQATAFGGFAGVSDAIVTPSSLLFDNRADFLQSSLDVNFIQSDRTVFTAGGQGFGIWRKAPGLVGMQGYELHGTIQRRMSRRTTLGVQYSHMHFDFPKAFGESDINSYAGMWAAQLSRFWTARVTAGIYQAEVQGLQTVAVDPTIVALLGVTSAVQTFYQKRTFPQWSASLDRRFQHADLSFTYNNGVSPGNGVYLTSRQQTATAGLSYQASRKLSFAVNAGYTRLNGIAQNLSPYSGFNGDTSLTYSITQPIHIVAQYQARRLEVIDATFRRTASRATIGISFSPGDVPLAFH